MATATGIFRDTQQMELIRYSPNPGATNYSVKWVYGGDMLQNSRPRAQVLPSHFSNFDNNQFSNINHMDQRWGTLNQISNYSTGAPRQEYYIFENTPQNIPAICVGLPSGANIVPVTTINLNPPVPRTVQGTSSIQISKNQVSHITINCP